GAHLGGELSYGYGLRVNRNVYEPTGPDEFTPVLDEKELPDSGMRRVELDGLGILLSRTDGGIHAISATCNHFSGPLEQGERDGDAVICPRHYSRFDLKTGEALAGPATFPQSRYETRVRDGKIEVKADPENAQKKVR
ncbi:MAG: Rieske (2Fe-2S) protein, partial [Rubrobacteraceae bacterium]